MRVVFVWGKWEEYEGDAQKWRGGQWGVWIWHSMLWDGLDGMKEVLMSQ